MILYKYVPFDDGMEILKNNSVGFTQPCYFNDPFEIEAAYPSEEGENPLYIFLNQIRTEAKKGMWKRNTGILSLTRQPLNPLMWAHYGAEHTGLVIGFDASISEFTCEKSNLVPVQYGSVIYTDIKPDTPFLSKPKEVIKLGQTFHFPYEQLERLQRTLLFKPMCWSYEEEVRVAKCLNGIEKNKEIESGSFNEIDIRGRPLYLLDLPQGAIKEVHLGASSEILKDIEKAQGFLEQVEKYQDDVKISACKIANSSWNLESYDLEKAANQYLAPE